jgi:hypothetical protein
MLMLRNKIFIHHKIVVCDIFHCLLYTTLNVPKCMRIQGDHIDVQYDNDIIEKKPLSRDLSPHKGNYDQLHSLMEARSCGATWMGVICSSETSHCL